MKTSIIADLMAGRWEGLSASNEALSELPGATECEYVFFYKLSNPSQLFKATEILEQEQWQVAIPPVEGSKYKGWIRVRKEKTKTDDEAELTATVKVAEEGVSGRKELNVRIDEAFFECFKLLCAEGMRKTRFIFPIEGSEGKGPDGGMMKWEVDVFDDPNDEGVEHWVKVDLEVGAPLEQLPEFPLAYEKSITNQWNQRTEDEQEFIKQLFSRVYSTANQQPAVEPTPESGDENATEPTPEQAEGTEAETKPADGAGADQGSPEVETEPAE